MDKIYVDGLSRTKDDIIIATVKDLFQAKDFQEVIVGAHKVRGKLEGLGCFRNIGIFIDTSSGPDATPDGVEVLISLCVNSCSNWLCKGGIFLVTVQGDPKVS